MSSSVAISVRGLSKQYRLGETRRLHGSLRDAVAARLEGRRRLALEDVERPSTIWALEDVDFDVVAGDVVGIIGRNGAGKTTLLKILSRITEPTRGEARLSGRVGSLLEVGTGFHPDLTGRENVFLNGAILSMKRRETAAKFDEIVAFAEVERFVDTPVKRYSSGMYLRLAFAVAAYLEPEILIVDEVLAVGDNAFQRKCLGKMEEVSSEGRTVLLVSHNMASVTSLASRCIWLESGRVREIGEPSQVVSDYLSSDLASAEPGVADLRDLELRRGVSKRTQREVLFDSVRLVDREGEPASVFFEQEPMRIELKLSSRVSISRLEVLCLVVTLEGTLVFTLTFGPESVDLAPGTFDVAAVVPASPLRPGRYKLDLYVLTNLPQDYVSGAVQFEVVGPRGGPANPRAGQHWGVVTVDHEWESLRQSIERATT